MALEKGQGGQVPPGSCGHVIDSLCHPEYSGDHRCVLKGG